MKSVYDPDNNDVMEWVRTDDWRWPESDWDFHVLNGKNDDLILTLANDETCVKQSFFHHCLYCLAGEYFNDEVRSPKKRQRLDQWLNHVDENSVDVVRKWRRLFEAVEGHHVEFVPDNWFNSGVLRSVKDY